MNFKLFINLFFILPPILLLSPIALPLQSNTDETIIVSEVLGRTGPPVLFDNFENKDWKFNRETNKCCHEFWRDGSGGDGVPELVEWIRMPPGGKKGSIGALEICRKVSASDRPAKKDLHTAEFKDKLKRNLIRADKPLFSVHVLLPPLHEWGEGDDFGFRHESFLENGSEDQNYSSIFISCRNGELFFMYRFGTNKLFYEVYNPQPIEQTGWWTLAVAFDENGFDHYYTRPGFDDLAEKDRVFDSTQLLCNAEDTRPTEQSGWRTRAYARDEEDNQYVCEYPGVKIPAGIDRLFDPRRLIAKYGEDTFLINYFNYSFFTLGYPSNGDMGPRFVIDDYKVRITKREE